MTTPHPPLRHLIVSREFPPAAYPPGGIGTYTGNIARLLATAGETVHVIGERWSGAPLEREVLCEGRLVIHRVGLEEPRTPRGGRMASSETELRLLGASGFPAQRFSWQAALLAERLIEQEHIDVIEGQDWEAPLYYLLLRRALGLGPARLPPCLVHVHSPTEFIYRHNEWAAGRPQYAPMVRLEEYCIGAADALLCPSRYLADQAAARYAIPAGRIRVIPYPTGDFPFIPRGAAAWNGGGIIYIGRLEPRKGLIEFVEAAVDVAQSNPSARFDFVGDDVRYRGSLSVRRYMETRIPGGLRERFRFHGVQHRAQLPRLLAKARAAVIPSRWENFPNTCIEAMCSGLPVIASPNGGMAELLEDGVTGWLAPSQAPDGLAIALRRALATAPQDCEAMGRAAALAIQGRCGNEVTTPRHVGLRVEVAQGGATRSVRLPDRLDRARRSPPPIEMKRRGLGVVVDALENERFEVALRSLQTQSVLPTAVMVLNHPTAGNSSPTETLSRAVRSLIQDHGVAAVALVPGTASLTPEFIAVCGTALERDAELGLVSGWLDDGGGGFLRPCPMFPYQWIEDDVGAVAVVRAEAFLQAGGLRSSLPVSYARWDLHNAVLACGWKAVSFPAVLARVETIPSLRGGTDSRSAALLHAIKERFPEELAADSARVAELEGAPDQEPELRVRDMLRMPVRTQIAIAADALRNPRRVLDWFRGRWDRRRR